MATFGEILSNLVVAAGQSIRRNALDNAFEAVTELDSTAFNGFAKITVSATPPAMPDINDLWVDIS